nr:MULTISPECIES: DUF418 domain-containing protein [unclassified Ruegeria]
MAIGLLLKLWPRIEKSGLAPALTTPGRMSLTLYMAHILIGIGILEAAGLLNGSLSALQIVTYALGFCAVSSVLAVIWARKFKRGPLEALMRRVTEPRRA